MKLNKKHQLDESMPKMSKEQMAKIFQQLMSKKTGQGVGSDMGASMTPKTRDEKNREAVQRAGIDASYAREKKQKAKDKEARLLARLGITAGAMQQRQTAGAKDFAAGGAGGIGLGEESFGFAPNQGSQSPDAGASATPAAFNTIAGFGKKDVSAPASQVSAKVSLGGKGSLSKSIGGLKAKVTVYDGKKFIQVDDDDERLEYYRMNARDAAKDVQQKINFLNKVGSLENERIKDLEVQKNKLFQIADGQPVSPLSNDIVQQNQAAQITGQDVEQIITNRLQRISGIPRD